MHPATAGFLYMHQREMGFELISCSENYCVPLDMGKLDNNRTGAQGALPLVHAGYSNPDAATPTATGPSALCRAENFHAPDFKIFRMGRRTSSC